ncbi:MAG: hypothetical protein AAGF23_09015 [Acidobacteriota bacterium]
MRDDPIVEEIRMIRERHAEQFDFDLRKIFEDIRRQEKISGHEYVSRSPKLIQKKSA